MKQRGKKSLLLQRTSIFALFLALATCTVNLWTASPTYPPAVIKYPIIEMNSSFPPPVNAAASPDTKGCPRAHQGLYNEVVDCIEQQDDCLKIAYKNIIYGFDRETGRSLNTFWIYKRGVVPLHELENSVTQAIPHQDYAHEPTIVLIYPWQNFSVGTRFKRRAQYDTKTDYAITRADFATNAAILDFVPRENAIPEVQLEPAAARNRFVTLINALIDRVAQTGENNVIPYVWGGSSFVQPDSQPDFYSDDGRWHRKHNTDIYAGYDCSEFVMRMAQIAGIPFPWKTTLAIQRSRPEINDTNTLEDGDLIWVQGHVMIISDIQANEIIESRSYGSGYGCVHRIKLDECFEGIATYNDLLERYFANKTIRFKNKRGIPGEKSNLFKLLKLID